MAFKRNKIKLPNFSNLKLAEDQIFLAEVFSNSRNCAFTEKIVYRYFIGSQYHLTSDSRNLVDLNRALGILDGLEINEMNKYLIGLMTFKNSLTLISKGSLKLKYRGLLSLFYTILIRRNPYQTIKLAAKVIFTKGLYN
jgi:hypothetical protein